MGLQDKLLKGESTLTGYNGTTPPLENKSLSKLHFDYSINGKPELLGNPSPSELDLNGKVPAYNYKNNAPVEGVGRI
jgi:hypothetical protein